MLNTQLQTSAIDISVIIPALDEVENLKILLPSLRLVLDTLNVSFEIIIIDRNPKQETSQVAAQFRAKLVNQIDGGYGKALKLGFAEARGSYLLTMDADLSHPPTFIADLWNKRAEAEILIASRYIPGASAKMPMLRYILSRVLNVFFARGLSLYVRDMSSGFRLYNASALKRLTLDARDFDIIEEILVKAYCEGWKIKEIPFAYEPRTMGSSHARILAFGMAYLRTFFGLYRIRNSILSADYDDRASDSLVIPQRYWQRERFRHIHDLLMGQGPTLDVGCGSSRIIGVLPSGSIALDILLRKVRYARKFDKAVLQASGFDLPVGNERFTCVLCSQVIEHVPKNSPILNELCRVLAPGGLLILGTPDYANWQWNVIEAIYAKVLPSAYADEHISHYTKKELIDLFAARGFQLEATRYILQGELILALRKSTSGQID